MSHLKKAKFKLNKKFYKKEKHGHGDHLSSLDDNCSRDSLHSKYHEQVQCREEKKKKHLEQVLLNMVKVAKQKIVQNN